MKEDGKHDKFLAGDDIYLYMVPATNQVGSIAACERSVLATTMKFSSRYPARSPESAQQRVRPLVLNMFSNYSNFRYVLEEKTVCSCADDCAILEAVVEIEPTPRPYKIDHHLRVRYFQQDRSEFCVYILVP